jgi:hypothetical protein
MRAHGAVAGENLEIIGADIHNRIDWLVGHFLRDGVTTAVTSFALCFELPLLAASAGLSADENANMPANRKAVLAFFIGMASD